MRAGEERGFQDGIEAGREMERAEREERVREMLAWNAARHRVVFYVVLWLLWLWIVWRRESQWYEVPVDFFKFATIGYPVAKCTWVRSLF